MRRATLVALVLAVLVGIGRWLLTAPPMQQDAASGGYMPRREPDAAPIIKLVCAVLDPVKHYLLPLDEASLRQAASNQAGGLTDFGDMLNWEAMRGLNELAKSRHVLGRFLWRTQTVNALSVHLRLTRLLQDHPEIRDEPIDRPIAITGMARSGTTFLQHVLSHTYDAEPAVRHLRFWEVATDPFQPDPTKRRAEASMVLRLMLWLQPNFVLLHEILNIDVPDEEVGWTKSTFMSGFNVLVSNAGDDEFDASAVVRWSGSETLFRFLKVMLQVTQWQEGSRYRWILKSMDQLSPLFFGVFPDARLVVSDRDPAPAFKSFMFLQAGLASSAGQKPASRAACLRMLCSQYCHLLSLRHFPSMSNSSSHVFVVDFSDLVKKTKQTLEALASFAELPWDTSVAASADRAIERQRSAKPVKLVYDMSEFGYTEDQIAVLPGQCQSACPPAGTL